MTALNGKTILVTGGAGFVGSNLVKALVHQGAAQVISLDSYYMGTKTAHIDRVDYRDGHTKDITQLVPEIPDLIFHLGEYSRVEKSVEEPDVVWDLNIHGTFNVFEIFFTPSQINVACVDSTDTSYR